MRVRPALALVVAGVAGYGGAVFAAPPQSASATGIANVTVVQPIGVVPVADMEFGTITQTPGTGGTVTVAPGVAGAQFGGGASAVCTGAVCITAHPAAFAISGEAARSYAVSLPQTISARADGGQSNLAVSALTVRSANGGNSPRLDSAGRDRLEVGGTIVLPADQPPAHYRASFSITVNYG